MSNGLQSATFPNNARRISWKPGDPLSLTVRWASGSEYRPLQLFESPVKINDAQGSATFINQSLWSIFEWSKNYNLETYSTTSKSWLRFSVPVGLKSHTSNAANPSGSNQTAYTSELTLTLSAIITDSNGQEKALAIPYKFPVYAPGFPGSELAYQEN